MYQNKGGGWTHTLLQNFQAQKRNVRNCDSHRIWMGKYFGTLLPPVQGNKSVLHLASGHPDAENRNKGLTGAPSVWLLAKHRAAFASSEFSSCVHAAGGTRHSGPISAS